MEDFDSFEAQRRDKVFSPKSLLKHAENITDS